jgi:SpoVK/Ycf46/Vps4 family AAA+-type ATPase
VRARLLVREQEAMYHSAMSHQKLILELSRLALAGDPEGSRQFLGRALRRINPEDDETTTLREGLAQLLVRAAAATRLERRSRRAVATPAVDVQPMDPDFAKLTHVERLGKASEPVLQSGARRVLDAIVSERQQADKLRAAGLEPTRSLLLTGTPGVGKTMTARYLAAVLELPLVTIDLTAIMSSYLGQTGKNLRRALDVARTTSCLFFIDEIDALAKRRNDETDVGELKRTVNILLLELERWPVNSVLVAATNHPELLDRAIWRRFDRAVHLSLPRFDTRSRILANELAEFGQEVDAKHIALCAAATEGLAGSGLVQLTRDAVRATLLAGEGEVGQRMAHLAMQDLVRRSRSDERARIAFCGLASRELGLSHREIAKRIGISHVQVGRLIRQTAKLPQNGEVVPT